MKSIAAVAFIVAFVVAEPPPSNSYLPPSSNRGAGYPQSNPAIQGGPAGLPQVVAARSLGQGFGRDQGSSGHGAAANGFARNALQTGAHGSFGAQGHQNPNARGAQPRFNDQQGYAQRGQGYDSNAAALSRNALEEANAEPASYNFGYMVNDYQEGTDFGHHEERQEESAHGEYHVVLPDGRKQTVSYEADESGFKPQISYEDTEDLSRSGYDSNANNFRTKSGNQEHGYQGNDHGFHGNDQNGRSQNGGHANARSGY